jgi:hypothetical protein
MRADAAVIERQGDLGGQKVKMSFDENSLAHIMSVLTDLYSDPELAVIREYSTNALDSHIEAGVARPIEVTLPTNLSPYFKVRDYGIGLSVNDIERIYSKYGASTKRDTDDQIGMLGLGCKSALTYTSQFTLRAVKNGVRVHVMISRVEDGSGVMEIVDTCTTDEQNGVEVVVPAKSQYSFHDNARKFFRFWQPGTVLIDGEEPELINGTKIANCVLIPGERKDYVVMGNVAYPVEEPSKSLGHRRLYTESFRTFGIAAHVEIGDVNFTPSREALQYTAKTKETLARIRQEFAANVMTAISDDISNASTHDEAWTRYGEWKKLFGHAMPKNLTYKDELIPEIFYDINHIRLNPNRWRHQIEYYSSVHLDSILKSPVVVNFPTEKKLSGWDKKKIIQWMDENQIAGDTVLIFKDVFPGEPWTNSVERVEWDVIKAIKVKREERERKATAAKYEVLAATGVFHDLEELDSSKPIIYYSPSEYDSTNWDSRSSAFTTDVQIVKIGINRWEKLKRDYPAAIPIGEYVNKELSQAYAALTESDKMVLAPTGSSKSLAQSLSYETIDDPDLVRYIESITKNVETVTMKRWHSITELCRGMGWHYKIRIIEHNNLFDRYPLLKNHGYISQGVETEHAAKYINAVYAASKEEV